jgi:leucyl aminopeptidase (aminopeptidase T)
MSGNMFEDERVVARVIFGFGNQDKSFKGKVGTFRHHVDVVLTSPSIYLDDMLIAENNKLNEKLGLKELM